MRLRGFLFLSALVFAVGHPLGGAIAGPFTDPQALVENLVSQTLAVLDKRPVDDQDRKSKFRALLVAHFDVPRLSRFMLGLYWATASDQERNAFNGLFEDWVVRRYTEAFKDYNGEKVTVTGSRVETASNTVIQSEVIGANGEREEKVAWRLRKAEDGSFKIIDVTVDGVSLALVQRDEIVAVIHQNGDSVGRLNAVLREKLDSSEPAAH